MATTTTAARDAHVAPAWHPTGRLVVSEASPTGATPPPPNREASPTRRPGLAAVLAGASLRPPDLARLMIDAVHQVHQPDAERCQAHVTCSWR
ncbi:MAG: hypothetical protein ACYC1D_02550 [Acidimicrobiales bacterium]